MKSISQLFGFLCTLFVIICFETNPIESKYIDGTKNNLIGGSWTESNSYLYDVPSEGNSHESSKTTESIQNESEDKHNVQNADAQNLKGESKSHNYIQVPVIPKVNENEENNKSSGVDSTSGLNGDGKDGIGNKNIKTPTKISNEETNNKFQEQQDSEAVENVTNSEKPQGTTNSDTNKNNDDGNGKLMNTLQMKTKQMFRRLNIYRVFEKPFSEPSSVNYFKNEMQNDFAFRNGLHFSYTSVYLYNKYVDPNKHVYIKLPNRTMVILVTANKFFFQDLIYSSNKYLSMKNKFAYLMNIIIDNLKGKIFFKNYNYQYLFRDDPFALDPSKKLLDFDLLGHLAETTQTIYANASRTKKVSMHKEFGGWFQFLGILVVNGYYYNDIIKPEPIEVVPYEMLPEFRKLLNEKTIQGDNYSYTLGLWKDFPNDKFSSWRYSLELLLWDSLNILPSQLPHPARFVMAYTNIADKEKISRKLEYGYYARNTSNYDTYTKEELLNWPLLVKNVAKELKGIDVSVIAADDYYKAVNAVFHETSNEPVGVQNKSSIGEYILLILLNSEFYNDKFVTEDNYFVAKSNVVIQRILNLIEKLQNILNKIKEELEPYVDNDIRFYSFFNKNEQNYRIFNPHILGSVAGITKHLACENVKYFKCTKDVSIHHKYGGWFEFAGAIHIMKALNVPLKYESHEILKKEYEQSILLQANSNYQYAGLWRDIPEKDTSAYRYPLHAFLLENPELNIINIQKAHPFMVVDLINKGLQAVKANIFPKRSATVNEEKMGENNQEKKIDVTELESEVANTVDEKQVENTQNLMMSLGYYDSYLKENVKSVNDMRLDESDDEIIEVDEDEEDTQEVNEDVNYSEENYKEHRTQDTDVYGMSEDEEGEEKEKEKEKNGKYKSPTDVLTSALKNDNNEDSSGVGKGSYIKNIEHVYEHNENGNDLNLLETDENENFGMNGRIFIFLLVIFIIILISLLIYLGVVVYKKYMGKKIDDKNDIVLAFKDKNEIPVVHGMPAPWLKA